MEKIQKNAKKLSFFEARDSRLGNIFDLFSEFSVSFAVKKSGFVARLRRDKQTQFNKAHHEVLEGSLRNIFNLNFVHLRVLGGEFNKQSQSGVACSYAVTSSHACSGKL